MLDDTKLFDFIKIMFTKKDHYNNLKNSSKKRHHFMVNRFMSIQFPANAQLFNINGISGSKVIDSWQMVAARFNKVPGWIYTKTKATKKNIKETYTPNEDVLRLYMEKNEIGNREIEELKSFNKEQFYNDLKKLEKQIRVYG
tara:strand:+ start:3672 stop:4097 length:426 start_codon:yes stop_codon:yes gene_type:complete